MKILYRDLQALPVLTEGGRSLGKVHDLQLDVDGHTIRKYLVKPGLLKEDLLIDPSQVVSIDAKAMIVRDEIISEPAMASTVQP